MEALATLASQVVQAPDNRNVWLIFEEHLNRSDDIGTLRAIAETYTPHTEISIPIYRRMLALHGDDVHTIVALGFALWLDGEDQEACTQLECAKRLEADNVEVLTLEAVLTKDVQAKKCLYEKILAKDPGHEVARENLQQLVHIV